MIGKTKQDLLKLLGNNKIYITTTNHGEPFKIEIEELKGLTEFQIEKLVENYIAKHYIFELNIEGEDECYWFDYDINNKERIESEDFIVIHEYEEDPDSYDLTQEEFEYHQQLTAIAEKLGFKEKWEIKEMKKRVDNASTLPTKVYSFNGIECFRQTKLHELLILKKPLTM